MSFQASYLSPRPAPSTVPQTTEDAAFLSLQKSLSVQVLNMNTNIQGIVKLVEQLGTKRDSNGLRKTLHDLTESTQTIAKRVSEDLRTFTTAQCSLPHRKIVLQKTVQDFQSSLVAFQRAQKASAQRQRTLVGSVVQRERDDKALEHRDQLLEIQNQISPDDLDYQEFLIHERDQAIREIETEMHEVAGLFRDIGTLVKTQGDSIIDHSAEKIDSTARDVESGARPLLRAVCLMMLLMMLYVVAMGSIVLELEAGQRTACVMILFVIFGLIQYVGVKKSQA
ncbi:t-SNARE [Mycena floridula]|nr:t-SNARE [Mycena floridula]